VVADEDRLTGAHALADAAAAVRQDDRLAAGGDGRPDAVRDGGDPTPLVVVGAAQEDQRALLPDPVRADLAAVALHGRRREAGQLGDRELRLGSAQRVDGRRPAGAHHEGDVMCLGTRQLAQAAGGGVGGGVGVALNVVRDVVRQKRCVHADERSRSSPTRVDDRPDRVRSLSCRFPLKRGEGVITLMPLPKAARRCSGESGCGRRQQGRFLSSIT